MSMDPSHIKIGVFGKGGCGKSTVSLLLARLLTENYSTWLVDADSTNRGMAAALGLAVPPKPLLDHFGGMVFSGGSVTCPVDDPTLLEGAALTEDAIPPEYVGLSVEGIHLLTLGKVGSMGVGAGCDGPIAKIARDLRLVNGHRPTAMILDLKAGFEDAARGIITGLDWVLVVIDPTAASLGLAHDMKNMLEQVQRGVMPATSHLEDPALVAISQQRYQQAYVRGLLCLLNRVQDDDESETFLKDKLWEMGLTSSSTIHEYPMIKRAWMNGDRLPATGAEEELLPLLDRIEELTREKSTGLK
ncbi:MAG: hypothetical protein ACLFWD_01460 [Anaerolineales bacterium]